MQVVDQRALARLLREAIHNAGGPKALADRAELHVSNLHAYLRGRQRPHWATCASLARAGGISEHDLLIAAGWDAEPPQLSCTALDWPPWSASSMRSTTGRRRSSYAWGARSLTSCRPSRHRGTSNVLDAAARGQHLLSKEAAVMSP